MHFELSTLGIRVKLVEPGGVNTNFAGRSFVFTHDPELTDYQSLVDMAAAAIEEGTPTATRNPRKSPR